MHIPHYYMSQKPGQQINNYKELKIRPLSVKGDAAGNKKLMDTEYN